MDIKKLKCGVVGMGHIGKRHASIIETHPDFELKAVCDIKYERDSTARNVRRYIDFANFIQHEDLDMLSVCVPNHLHIPFSIQAINRGTHVLCEKPLGLTAESAKNLIRLAEDKGKYVFCVLQNRYSPTVQWLQSLIEEEKMGEIFHVQITCFWNRDERYYLVTDAQGEQQPHPWHGNLEKDSGPLFTQFSHFVDILIALFGRIQVNDARFFDFNHSHLTEFEDSGSIHFSTETNVQGHFLYSTSIWGQNAESSINIIGSKGTVKVGGQYMNRIDYCHIEDYQVPDLPTTNDSNQYVGYSGSANNHYFIFNNVADVILRGKQPDFPIEDAVHGVEVIEHIYSKRHEK